MMKKIKELLSILLIVMVILMVVGLIIYITVPIYSHWGDVINEYWKLNPVIKKL